MSQVRKLLNGNNIPKAQEGYKFHLDSQDIYLTDDDLKEIDDKIAALPMERRRFLGNATTAIKAGDQSGSRANNTWTSDMMSGLDERNMERLRKQEPSFWESFLPTDSYFAKQAGNDLLNIIYSVANKKKKETSVSTSKDKPKIGTDKITIDFNTDSEGKLYISPYDYNAKARIAQILEHLEKGATSPYNAEGWDFGNINRWLNGLKDIPEGKTKYDKARETFEDLWKKLEVHGFDKEADYNGEDIKDLFDMFGVTFSTNGSTPQNSGVRAINDPQIALDEDGNVPESARTSTGAYVIYMGRPDKGQDPKGYYTNAPVTEIDSFSKPYLITEKDWKILGLDKPELERFKHGIIYQGRLLTQDDLNNVSGLPAWGIMEQVRGINNDPNLTGFEKNEALKQYINWRDKDLSGVEYGFFDYNTNNASFANSSWNDRFGSTPGNISFFDATEAYGQNGINRRLIGAYDYRTVEDNNWGFRQPILFWIDDNGNILSDSVEGLTYNPFITTNNFNTNKYIKTKETITDSNYGKQTYDIYNTVYNVDTRQNIKVYHRVVDGKDKYYVKYEDKLIEISDALKKKIDSKKEIRQREVAKGKTKEGYTSWQKEGGKIEHIAKLQQGRNIKKAPELEDVSEPEDFSTEQHPPVYPIDEKGKIHLSSLPLEEQLELVGVATDLLGTIAGFTGEYGDIAAAGMGLTADLFNYLPADIIKKKPWYSVAGNTLLNIGMDAVGLVPWIGDNVRMTKLGKALSRAQGLKKFLPYVSTTLNGLGLTYAIGPTMKLFNEGPKSLTTDDWEAVARGLQAVINSTRTRTMRRPEAALAEEISDIKAKGAMPSKYSATGIAPEEVKVKFNEREINEIRTAENPAQVLREKALAQGVDPEHLPVDDKDLLTRFGFVVRKGKDGKLKVSSPKGYTLDTHSQTLRSKDAGKEVPITLTNDETRTVLTGSGDGAAERLRTILRSKEGIDPTKIETDDVKLLRQYGFGVTQGWRNHVHVFKERGVADNVSATLRPEDRYTKWGWLSDAFGSSQRRQKFIDDAMKDNRVRPMIDEAVSSEDASTALRRGYARAVARQNPEAGELMTTKSGRYLFDPEKHEAVLKELERRRAAGNTTGESTPTSESSSGTSASSTSEPLNVPSESVSTSTTAPTSSTTKTDASKPISETIGRSEPVESPVESAMRKVGSTRTIDFGARKSAIQRKSAKKTAENMQKLKESKDPMQTLSEIMNDESALESDKMLLELGKGWQSLSREQQMELQKHPNFERFKTAIDIRRYRDRIRRWSIEQIDKELSLDPGFKEYVHSNPEAFLEISRKRVQSNKKGGIIKAQPGSSGIDWDEEYKNRSTEPVVDYAPIDRSIPSFEDAKISIDEALKYANTNKATVSKKPSIGGATLPIKDRSKYAFLGIETLGLLNKFRNQNRYRTEDESRINDGRYSLQSQQVDFLPTTNPLFQHRLNEIGLNRMTGLTGNFTNDWTAYNAALNQNQSKLNGMVRDITAQESQDLLSRESQNIGLRNQKYGFDTTTANEKSKLRGYFNSMMHNPKLAQILQQDQSEDNFKQLLSKMVSQDTNKIQAYNQSIFTMNQNRAFDSWLRDQYPDETEKYNNLTWQERMQFTDLQDFIERTNPGAIENIRIRREQDETDALNWLVSNGTNFNYSWLVGRRSPKTDVNGVQYSKKGGYLRGSTRYTKEPEEQIWIDNNKAANHAVAKLNEATLKMLLSALK